jgi:hypothetical protein
MMQYESGIMGKWLAMLKEVAPRLARVAFIKSGRYRAPPVRRAYIPKVAWAMFA